MSREIDASRFFKMCSDLSRISGRDFEHVVVDQVGQLMGVCIRYTYSSKAGTLKTRVEFQNRSATADNEGRLKSRYYRTKGGAEWLSERNDSDERTSYLMNGGERRWNASRWARYQVLKQILADKQIDPSSAVQSRGSVKRTWYDIAAALGQEAANRTNAPSYVTGARTFHGKEHPQISKAERLIEAAAFFVEITNESRILTGSRSLRLNGGRDDRSRMKISGGLDGFAILQRAINTRANAFRTETRNGVFEDIETRAKRYPGIFTT